jgi:hypothetical protein
MEGKEQKKRIKSELRERKERVSGMVKGKGKSIKEGDDFVEKEKA